MERRFMAMFDLFELYKRREMALTVKTVILLICLLLGIHVDVSFAERQGFTVPDSIEMARFDDPWEVQKNAEAKFSPDQKHFIVVTSRGLIASNQIESTLWLFDAAAVRRFVNARDSVTEPTPRNLVRT